MAAGSTVRVMDTLIKYTMSREAAEKVKQRFTDMSAANESVSYLDCVLFDAALEVLGEEQAYYGMTDAEWQEAKERAAAEERQFAHVRTIDVTDTWHEVMS